MFNRLEMTTIAQNGFGQQNPLADRYEASAAFESALLWGKLHALGHRLAGKPHSLRHLPAVGATPAPPPAGAGGGGNGPPAPNLGLGGGGEGMPSRISTV